MGGSPYLTKLLNFPPLEGERYVYKFVCDPEALFQMALAENHRNALKLEAAACGNYNGHYHHHHHHHHHGQHPVEGQEEAERPSGRCRHQYSDFMNQVYSNHLQVQLSNSQTDVRPAETDQINYDFPQQQERFGDFPADGVPVDKPEVKPKDLLEKDAQYPPNFDYNSGYSGYFKTVGQHNSFHQLYNRNPHLLSANPTGPMSTLPGSGDDNNNNGQDHQQPPPDFTDTKQKMAKQTVNNEVDPLETSKTKEKADYQPPSTQQDESSAYFLTKFSRN